MDENGRVSGVALSVFDEAFYFVTQKFNISYSELDPKLSRCIGSECSYAIQILQEKVYSIAGLVHLPRLFPNITSGPPLSHIQCFLATIPEIREDYRNNSVMDVFHHIDHYTIGLYFLISLLLIFLLKFEIHLDSLMWTSARLFLDKFFPLNVVHKFCLFFIVIFISYMNLFFTSSVQTTMVKIRNFRQVDTLEDVLDRNLSSAFVAYDCESLVRLISNDEMRERLLWKSESFYEDPDPTRLFGKVRRLKSKFCMIAKKQELSMLLHLSCSPIGNKFLTRRDIYSSPKSILSTIGSNYLSQKTPSDIGRIFNHVAYNSYEMKLFREPISPRLAHSLVGETNVKCANDEANIEQAYFSSLRMDYFSILLYMYSIFVIASSLLLFAENLRPPVHPISLSQELSQEPSDII